MGLLYNDDLAQYADGFWATVDPYRLPGITVAQIARADSSGTMYVSPAAWVGGASLDAYGATGMQLDAFGSSLVAKKSWFTLDDEIVALGSDITCAEAAPVETVVENRKLSAGQRQELVVNGIATPQQAGWAASEPQARWAWLEGVGGYWFPTPAALDLRREDRTGKWSTINPAYGSPPYTSGEPLTRSFATLLIPHGRSPSGASYAYTLLPGRSPEQVAAYADQPRLTVLDTTPVVHAIRHEDLALTAANFWAAGTTSNGQLRASGPASVLVRQRGRQLRIGVADPTQRAATLLLELPLPRARGLVSADSRVTVESLSPSVRLRVDVDGAAGRTATVTLDLG